MRLIDADALVAEIQELAAEVEESGEDSNRSRFLRASLKAIQICICSRESVDAVSKDEYESLAAKLSECEAENKFLKDMCRFYKSCP